jgi:hypothetical protein
MFILDLPRGPQQFLIGLTEFFNSMLILAFLFHAPYPAP